jgi:hypothetical protein
MNKSATGTIDRRILNIYITMETPQILVALPPLRKNEKLYYGILSSIVRISGNVGRSSGSFFQHARIKAWNDGGHHFGISGR